MSKFILSAFADEAGAALDRQIAALTRNNIRLLEIRGVDGVNVGSISAQEARRIRTRLADAGISVRSIGSPFGKQDINADFAEHFDAFRRCLDTACELDAKYMRIFSFFMPADARREQPGGPGPDPYAPYFDEVCLRLSRFADAAKEAGIMLCHENEKGIYGDVAERCVQLHEAFPQLRAVFDPANFIQCGVDTLAAWALLKPYVEYMHVKDARANGTVVAAGFGVGNVARIIREFGSGMLTLEPHLAVFEGLKKLETDRGRMAVDGSVFASADEAFDFAANSLKKILEDIES